MLPLMKSFFPSNHRCPTPLVPFLPHSVLVQLMNSTPISPIHVPVVDDRYFTPSSPMLDAVSSPSMESSVSHSPVSVIVEPSYPLVSGP